MQYISEDAEIGLVSYSDKVTIELPIGRFEGQHRGRFQSAVKSLQTRGGTYTNSGIVIAIDMIRRHQAETDMDANYMIFVLSDGESTGGVSNNITAQLIVHYAVPVHTIAYGVDASPAEMQQLAGYTEGFSVAVDEENVIYNLRNMFNSQM
jgi:Ca-activated chloride channel family protein